jgi:hypothetical protein
LNIYVSFAALMHKLKPLRFNFWNKNIIKLNIMNRALLIASMRRVVGFGAYLLTAGSVAWGSSLKVNESYPSLNAYVMAASQEQLSGQAFQQDALLTCKGYQYTVYYNGTRNVCIARRKLPLGAWQEVALPYRNARDDAHNVISMGICKRDGSIHLAYDHHNDDLHYSRSLLGSANQPDSMAWSAENFSAHANIMDTPVIDVTYPRFISKPDGNLLFECRYKLSGDGDSYLREYDGDTHTWSLVGRYVQGMDATPDACAYINRMDYDLNGRLHVSWCWRDDFNGMSNHDLYYGYSDDHGRTWKDKNGRQVAQTDSIGRTDSRAAGACMNQSKATLKLKDIPYNKGYINQESQATDSRGQVHMLNSYIEGNETDANWASSRAKAALHHHYVDQNGALHHNLIKNGESNVNSYCRAQIVLDAFDNAYVIANGAEIYTATSAAAYEDWRLLTDRDKGRFCSEPQVDRTLLKEGILSFVYLGRDKKITVIDYLLDNPHTPDGVGLKVEYFAGENFTLPVGAAAVGAVSTAGAPGEARSIRWSGAFETSFGEEYTLYVRTSEALTVEVDGKTALLTKQTSGVQEYAFGVAAIASHRHSITVELRRAAKQQQQQVPVSLWWSSSSVTKAETPLSALYPQAAFEVASNAPLLPQKRQLDSLLQGEKAIGVQEVLQVAPFDPQGDYSVEVRAQLASTGERSLTLEAYSRSGKGYRVALSALALSWLNANAATDAGEELLISDNSVEQTFRLAVEGSKVYIYHGEKYIATRNLIELADTADEQEGSPSLAPVPLSWAGAEGDSNLGLGSPDSYGWGNTVNLTTWQPANSGSGVRFLDATSSSYSAHTCNGSPYAGRLMTIRWDGAYGYYSLPVTLEASAAYEFSMLYEWWNNGNPVSITTGISTTRSEVDMLAASSFPVPHEKNVLQKAVFTFTTAAAGTYYLLFSATGGAMYGIGELALAKKSYKPHLTLTGACEGTATIATAAATEAVAGRVSYVAYSNGAYAPGGAIQGADTASQGTTPQDTAPQHPGSETYADGNSADLAATVFIENETLRIDSPFTEKVEVYSTLGSRLRHKKKQPGVASISLAGLPPQILVVRGEAGWTRKVAKF